MRITEIRECTIPISRYAGPALPSCGLITNLVQITTDVVVDESPATGLIRSAMPPHNRPR